MFCGNIHRLWLESILVDDILYYMVGKFIFCLLVLVGVLMFRIYLCVFLSELVSTP